MTVRRALSRYLSYALPAIAMLGADDVGAAAVSIHPSLQTSVSFADNIALAGSGNEEDEVVFIVTPTISVRGDGSRARVDLRYGLDSLYYFDEPSRSNNRHLLQGSANAVLAENMAYISGTGWVRHQSVDPGTNAGLGNLAVTESVGQVATWTLSPYLQHQFGAAAVARAAVNMDYVDYPGTIRDSFGREYLVSVSNGPRFAKLKWTTTARTKYINYSGDTSDNSLVEYGLNWRYQAIPDWAVVGSVGYLSYDYPNNPLIARSPEGNQWRAGISWTPSTRTEVEVGAGEHFYGPLRYGRMIHRARNVYTELHFDEEITTNRELQFVAPGFVTDPNTGEQTPVGESVQVETEEVFVNERTRFLIGYLSRKVDMNLALNNEHRRYETSSGEETVFTGSMSLRWIASARSAWILHYDERTIHDVTGGNDVVRNTSFAYEKRFSAKTTVSADVQRVARNHESPTVTDYVAHVFSVRALMQF